MTTRAADERDWLIVGALLVVAALVAGSMIWRAWWYWRLPYDRIVPVPSPSGRVYDCLRSDTRTINCWPILPVAAPGDVPADVPATTTVPAPVYD